MRKIVIFLGITVFAISSRAGATPLVMDYTGVGKAEIVSVSGVRTVSAWAGEINWNWVGTAPAGWQASFFTYCVDLLNNLRDPQVVELRPADELTSPYTSDAGEKVSWLVQTYAPMVHGATGTAAMGAGLQLAIWEALYDNAFDLSAGNFKVTSASTGATSAAKEYLLALAGLGGVYGDPAATWLDVQGVDTAGRPLGQDQVTVTPIPEPASLLLLGSGITAIAARRKRRNSNA